MPVVRAWSIFTLSMSQVKTQQIQNYKVLPYHSGIFVQDNPRLSNKISLIFSSFVHLLATKPMAKWSQASGQSARGLWGKNRAEICLFLSNLFNFSAIFVLVPFCELVRIWSSFLSILFCSKYFQSNFEVPALSRSLSLGLIPTVLFLD